MIRQGIKSHWPGSIIPEGKFDDLIRPHPKDGERRVLEFERGVFPRQISNISRLREKQNVITGRSRRGRLPYAKPNGNRGAASANGTVTCSVVHTMKFTEKGDAAEALVRF